MKGSKDKFSLHEYTQMFKRRKWFFIVPLSVIYISFLVSSFFLPRIYEAKAIILVEEKKVVNPLLKNLAVSSTVAERIDSLQEEILAWPRLYQLVERLKLNKEVKSPLELEKLILDIRKNIILKMKSADVVVIGYQGKDRRGTQQLVNTLCDILIERNVSLINEDTESAIDFIEQQIAIYKEKLNASESALREFKEIYGLEVLPQPEQFEVQETTISPDGTGVQAQGLNQPQQTTKTRNSSAGFATPIAQLSTEIAGLEADLMMASVDCTEEHPRVKELKRKIEALKEKREKYIKEAAEKTGVKAEAYVQIAGSLPRQQEELARLARDKEINERIYSMLLQRLESAKITESLDNSENRTKFRIIEPARLPLFAIKPNKLKLNFLGLILGGMVGFGFTYLLEYTDSSFKTPDDLKDTFGVPVLGNISKILTVDDFDKKGESLKKIIIIILLITVLATISSVIMARYGIGLAKFMG
jgi:uncharacterized protein involved in exopolysaccharide biosynthesis